MLFRFLCWGLLIGLLCGCEAMLHPVKTVKEARQALEPVPVLSREERWENTRMAGDYQRISTLYQPSLANAPACWTPEDCPYCWEYFGYGEAIDLDKAIKRIEAHLVTHPEGYRGLEVRIVVPRRYAVACRSMSCSLPYTDLIYNGKHRLKLWELGEQVAADTTPTNSLNEDLGFETLPPEPKESALFPLWSDVLKEATESEAVFRFFFQAYSQETTVRKVEGVLNVVITQGGFVPVAHFSRQDIGTTQQSSYGAITLLGFEDNRVQFELADHQDWRIFRVLGTNAEEQVIGLNAAQLEAQQKEAGQRSRSFLNSYQPVHRQQHRFFSDSPEASLDLYQSIMRPFYERFTFQPELATQHLGPLVFQKRLYYNTTHVSFYALPSSNDVRRVLSLKKS